MSLTAWRRNVSTGIEYATVRVTAVFQSIFGIIGGMVGMILDCLINFPVRLILSMLGLKSIRINPFYDALQFTFMESGLKSGYIAGAVLIGLPLAIAFTVIGALVAVLAAPFGIPLSQNSTKKSRPNLFFRIYQRLTGMESEKSSIQQIPGPGQKRQHISDLLQTPRREDETRAFQRTAYQMTGQRPGQRCRNGSQRASENKKTVSFQMPTSSKENQDTLVKKHLSKLFSSAAAEEGSGQVDLKRIVPKSDEGSHQGFHENLLSARHIPLIAEFLARYNTAKQHISVLNLSDFPLSFTDPMIELLAEQLEQHHYIYEIRFGEKELSDPSIDRLIELIQKNPNICIMKIDREDNSDIPSKKFESIFSCLEANIKTRESKECEKGQALAEISKEITDKENELNNLTRPVSFTRKNNQNKKHEMDPADELEILKAARYEIEDEFNEEFLAAHQHNYATARDEEPKCENDNDSAVISSGKGNDAEVEVEVEVEAEAVEDSDADEAEEDSDADEAEALRTIFATPRN